MKYYIITYLVILLVAYASTKPTNELDVVAYLKKFHYMKSSDFATLSEGYSSRVNFNSKLRDALTLFQSKLGLKVTGVMNKETMETMKSPRCGMSEFNIENIPNIRAKRYVLSGARWSRKRISYRIRSFTARMRKDVVIAQIRKAFQVWSEYTPLKFVRRTRGYATIMIDFKKFEHGDDFPFDGPGNILAHAYFPRSGGDIHFDESELWAKEGGSYDTLELLQVAVHEIGHSLGLKHTSVHDAVMYPTFSYKSNFRLHTDDINGITRLYGRK